MERPILKPIGAPALELDTPALVLDLDTLESNISNYHARFERSETKLRPHLQSHLCPPIAHIQLRAPGTVGGVAVSTVGQAETFAQYGLPDILIANLAVTRPKIARVAALAGRINLKIGSDNATNIADLARAAAHARSEIGVLVAVQHKSDFIGTTPSDSADLAALIRQTPGLKFAGLISSHPQPLLQAADNCAAASLDAPTVALLSPEPQDDPASTAGITEIIAGSYALMDAARLDVCPDLRPAARILTTVMTSQDEGLVWLDAGQKATGIDTGLPRVDGIPGASINRMSAEHGGMILEQNASWNIDLAGKVWLIPHNIANTVNVYDFIHVTRDDRLEAVWEIAARGRYD